MMNRADQWFKLCGRQITKEEYREICGNLSGFFKLLHEWDAKDKERRAYEIVKETE